MHRQAIQPRNPEMVDAAVQQVLRCHDTGPDNPDRRMRVDGVPTVY